MSTAQVPTLDMNKLNVFIRTIRELISAPRSMPAMGRHWGEVWGLYKALVGGPNEFCTNWLPRPRQMSAILREWLALTSCRGLRNLQTDKTQASSVLSESASFHAGERRQPPHICLGHFGNWLWARSRRFPRDSRNPSALATAWVGMNMLTASSMGVKSSFAQAMPPIL